MTASLQWAIGLSLGVLSFAFGGGWLWKTVRRAQRLTDADQLREFFPTRAEFDAHLREESAWRQRLQEDFMEPLRRQTDTLQQHAIAMGAQAEALRHLGEVVHDLKGEVRAQRT